LDQPKSAVLNSLTSAVLAQNRGFHCSPKLGRPWFFPEERMERIDIIEPIVVGGPGPIANMNFHDLIPTYENGTLVGWILELSEY
jgi:hypothetical protein